MELTDQQKSIVARDLRSGEILKVMAFAGTGKTTTLIEYAKARPQTRFLYVAFNKSVQLEAASKFPSNVVCKTSHALAFPRFGAKHKNRLVPGFKANTVQAALDLANYEDAKFTIDTLMHYLVSADAKVSGRHIPSIAKQHYERLRRPMPDFVAFANQLGRLMCNGDNPDIGMVHDGYLKLYQLSQPKLNFDCILLDEAQDINPVTSQIILSQAGIPRILVGDPNQQIYSFRGAKNSMDTVTATHTKFLTHSFRFNKNIARVANMILDRFKHEKREVVGMRAKGKTNGRFTVIARTNAKIFDEAVHRIQNKKKVGFVGGINGYRFNRILDAYNLYIGKHHEIKNPYIRSFEGFADMKTYAEAVEDFEITGMCKVVLNYRHNIPNLIERIKEKAVDVTAADVALTTAHKAKGLEWPAVLIADDFPDLVVDDQIIGPDELEPDEFNLIYVSLTRAMDSLSLAPGSSLKDFIKLYQQNP